MFETIQKRDGRVQEFDSSHITRAITKAGEATDEFGPREARQAHPAGADVGPRAAAGAATHG